MFGTNKEVIKNQDIIYVKFVVCHMHIVILVNDFPIYAQQNISVTQATERTHFLHLDAGVWCKKYYILSRKSSKLSQLQPGLLINGGLLLVA